MIYVAGYILLLIVFVGIIRYLMKLHATHLKEIYTAYEEFLHAASYVLMETPWTLLEQEITNFFSESSYSVSTFMNYQKRFATACGDLSASITPIELENNVFQRSIRIEKIVRILDTIVFTLTGRVFSVIKR